MVLRCSLKPSWFLGLWYLLLRAYVFFLITVSSSVHQGTDLLVIVFFLVRCFLNDMEQFAFRTSWKFSINFSMSVSSLALLLRVTSRSTDSSSVFVGLSLSSSNLSRFPWNLSCLPFSLYTWLYHTFGWRGCIYRSEGIWWQNHTDIHRWEEKWKKGRGRSGDFLWKELVKKLKYSWITDAPKIKRSN